MFHRWRIDHAPFEGRWPAARWPVGREVHERLSVAVPGAVRDAEYTIRLRLQHKPLIPNFALRDFLFNEDSYTGTPCGRLRVSSQVRR